MAATKKKTPGDPLRVSYDGELDGLKEKESNEAASLRAELAECRAKAARNKERAEAAEAVTAALQAMLGLRSGAVPAAPRTIKESLKWQGGGLYMIHFKSLIVWVADRPNERWCVVKVGIAGCINKRLTEERNEIRKYRGLPEQLRITTEDLKGDNDVGDIVLLCTGDLCNGQGVEEELRTAVGLPLGKGIVANEESDAVRQMLSQPLGHSVENWRNSAKADIPGKITVRGWLAYLCGPKSSMPTAEKHGSKAGLSELIMMREDDMLRIREAFKSNPASFANVRKDGPVWALVDKAKQALPPKWHKERVMVQFDRNELTLAPVDVSSLNKDEMRRLLDYSRKKAQTISAPELRRRCEKAMAKYVEENGPCPERLDELLPPLELKLWDPEEVKKENEKAPPKKRGRPKKN